MTSFYWRKTGRHQEDFERLKKIKSSNTPYMKLFNVALDIYKGFYNSGLQNWYEMIKSKKYRPSYFEKLPEDAPLTIQVFLQSAAEESKLAAEHASAMKYFEDDPDAYSFHEHGYNNLEFSKQKLEEFMDSVVSYVAKHQVDTAPAPKKTKKASAPKNTSCKIFNPTTKKWVLVHGDAGQQLLKKYAPMLVPKK